MNEAENSKGREGQESGTAAAYGGPAPQASGLWPSTASHTLCISEGPTDARVLFNGLCQRCCFPRFLAPQEYTLKRVVVNIVDYREMDLKYEFFI